MVKTLVRYINTKATKNGVKIGKVGVKKIHDALIEMFQKQGLKPALKLSIKEDDEEITQPGDPLDKALQGIGAMLNETVSKVLSGAVAATSTVSPPRKKRDMRISPKKSMLKRMWS